jgi:hypothetical protein
VAIRDGSSRGEYLQGSDQAVERWIGWVEEVSGVNCQERTKEELLESLRSALKETLAFNRVREVAVLDFTL